MSTKVRRINIVLSNYSSATSHKQPWLTAKIMMDTVFHHCEVIISDAPKDNCDELYVFWSLKNLLFRPIPAGEFSYILSFPKYTLRDLLRLNPDDFIKNWKELKRLIIGSLVPDIWYRRSLNKSRNIILLGDRQKSKIDGLKSSITVFYPVLEHKLIERSVHYSPGSIGYFGPPYAIRGYNRVIKILSEWKGINQSKFSFVLREDNVACKEEVYSLKRIFPQAYVESGVFPRNELFSMIQSIEVLFLPFKVVMSEFPLVVLEARLAGVKVITTADCGMVDLLKDDPGFEVVRNRFNSHDVWRSYERLKGTTGDCSASVLEKLNTFIRVR